MPSKRQKSQTFSSSISRCLVHLTKTSTGFFFYPMGSCLLQCVHHDQFPQFIHFFVLFMRSNNVSNVLQMGHTKQYFSPRVSNKNNTVYYIHTEKYSPKSYVVNFRTQISCSQSEERTMVFTREKNNTSNQNRERCFFTCEKNDTSNQKPQRCASFAPKFPPFITACNLRSGPI